MTKKPTPPIADLIAQTPGAQTRDEAKASLKARRERLLNTTATPLADPTAPEPIPDVDTQGYARDFFARMMEKETQNQKPPARGSKPRIVIDNDDPQPPEKS